MIGGGWAVRKGGFGGGDRSRRRVRGARACRDYVSGRNRGARFDVVEGAGNPYFCGKDCGRIAGPRHDLRALRRPDQPTEPPIEPTVERKSPDDSPDPPDFRQTA